MGLHINPISRENRIITLDIIRGFALFGILLVNMAFFNTPKLFIIGTEVLLFADIGSRIANYFILVFATGKFFTIFSFLFGLGFFIFMDRIQDKGLHVAPLYRRRLFFLFILGFIHAVFIWSGDILLTYSIAGFLLLFFRNSGAETIKKWAIWLFVIVNIVIGLLTYLSTVVEAVFDDGSEIATYNQDLVQQAISIYQSGNFAEILSFRLAEEVPIILFNLVITVPFVLSVFLFGLFVGKKGITKNIDHHLNWIYSVWKKSFIFSAILTVVLLVLRMELVFIPFHLHFAILEIISYVTGLVMSFFYMTSIALLYAKQKWLKFLSVFAPVGQMALTNYLTQTMICLIIFNGFGFYGKVAPELGIVLTIVIFILQTYLSHYWLKKYRFGPIEWLWRAFTYKHIPRMKVKNEGVT